MRIKWWTPDGKSKEELKEELAIAESELKTAPEVERGNTEAKIATLRRLIKRG